MEIKVTKSFENRDALDNYVKSRFGENADNNQDIILEMEETEMTALSLSESTTVHGIRVAKKVTDEEAKLPAEEENNG